MPSTRGTIAPYLLAAALIDLAPQAQGQGLPEGITQEDLAKDNNLFVTLARKAFKLGRVRRAGSQLVIDAIREAVEAVRSGAAN